MTGMAQIFIFSFIIIAVLIFGYIIYNYAINEFKKEYRAKKLEEGEELLKFLKERFSTLEDMVNDKEKLQSDLDLNNLTETMNDLKKYIILLEDFIKNI